MLCRDDNEHLDNLKPVSAILKANILRPKSTKWE